MCVCHNGGWGFSRRVMGAVTPGGQGQSSAPLVLLQTLFPFIPMTNTLMDVEPSPITTQFQLEIVGEEREQCSVLLDRTTEVTDQPRMSADVYGEAFRGRRGTMA